LLLDNIDLSPHHSYFLIRPLTARLSNGPLAFSRFLGAMPVFGVARGLLSEQRWEPGPDATHNNTTRAGETVARETIETHETINDRPISSGWNTFSVSLGDR
jgi:hypothetical protein